MSDALSVHDALSIQERLYPQLTCFGCGPANTKGLRLRSFPIDDGVTAEFRPWPEHDNGFGFLNGGIIATLLDCHSGAAVYGDEGRRAAAAGEGLRLFVTAGIDVRYLRPVPLAETVRLHATISSTDERRTMVEARLQCQGKICATASAEWRRWLPR